jgi:hypothetical protein
VVRAPTGTDTGDLQPRAIMTVMDPMPPEALLGDVPEPMAAIARRLRLVVRQALPDAVERVRTGWRIIGYDVPIGRRAVYFAWIWPQVEHVHLGFVHGVAMDDPERRLHGQHGVKLARWVTLSPGDPIDEPALGALVREGARVALLPRAEGLWHVIDREAGPTAS